MSSRTSPDLPIPGGRSTEVVPVTPVGGLFEDTVVAVPSAPNEISPTAFWLLLAILASALALRIPGLNSGLWSDEIGTLLHFVRLPFHDIPLSPDRVSNHVLFSMLAKLSSVLLGYSTWTLRLPAVVLGVLGVYAVYRLGREVAGEREGMLAAAFIAASSPHVFFSQNARGYTGMFLFATLAAALLLRLLDRTRRDSPTVVSPAALGVTTLGYTACLFLGVLSHLTAAAIIAVHMGIGLWVFLRGTHRSVVLGATVIAGLMVTLAVLPALPTLLAGDGVGVSTGVEWSSLRWFLAETLRGIGWSLPGGWIVLALAFGVVALGIISVGWRRPTVVVALLGPALLIPVLLVATHHNLWPRFFFFAGGYAAVFGVRGVMQVFQVAPGSSWRGKVPGLPTKVGTFLLWVVVLGSVFAVPRVWGPKQDFEGARDWLAENGSATRVVGVVPFADEAMFDYLEVDGTVVDDESQLTELEELGSPVHIVYAFPAYVEATVPELWARLQADYTVVRVLPGTIRGGEVVILERDGR